LHQSIPSHSPVTTVSRKKPVSPLLRGFIWGGCFTLTAFISGMVGVTVALKSLSPIDAEIINDIKEKIVAVKELGFRSLLTRQLQQPINLLVMGIDRVPSAEAGPELSFAGRSDTMLVVRFQPQDHSLRILSIPRDSRIRLPNGTYDKINSANARGGIPFTKQVIQTNLTGIVIDKYARVTTDVFTELVDLIGGVEVYVPTDMKYTDKTQGLSIDLKEGKQTLNGKQAEQFVRFRQDNLGDIGRVQRQQIFLKAFQQKMQSPQAILKIPQALKLLQDKIDTDLTPQEILSLGSFCLGLDQEDVRMVMLPGRASNPQEYRLSYWLISERGKDEVIKQYLEAPSNSSLDSQKSPLRIRIAIQNATSNPEVAKTVARFLVEQGFRNVYFSSDFVIPTKATQIIVQKGDYDSAQMVQRILDLGKIEASSTGDITSDITIRLGTDAEKFLAGSNFTR
jgi:LCP family protein required for cell wall assembly